MKLTFTVHDAYEISSSVYRAFLSTFPFQSDVSDYKSDESGLSDLSDFEPDTFGCGEITEKVENFIEGTQEICDPLDEVYGSTTSELIKQTVSTVTEESQCAGLNFFKDITLGENRDLIINYVQV